MRKSEIYDNPLGVADLIVNKDIRVNSETEIFVVKAIFGRKILARSSKSKFQSYDWL